MRIYSGSPSRLLATAFRDSTCPTRSLGRTFATEKPKEKQKSRFDQVKVPVLFLVGLYFGVVVFSDKQEANVLTEMKKQFRNEKK